MISSGMHLEFFGSLSGWSILLALAMSFCGLSPILLSAFVAWHNRRELRRAWLFAILPPLVIYAGYFLAYTACALVFNHFVCQTMPQMADRGQLDHDALTVKLVELFHGGYSIYVQYVLLLLFALVALRLIYKRWNHERFNQPKSATRA